MEVARGGGWRQHALPSFAVGHGAKQRLQPVGQANWAAQGPPQETGAETEGGPCPSSAVCCK